MKKIGIIGSRKRNSKEDLELCHKCFIEIYEEGDTIISGGCALGGDNFAEKIAEQHNIPIKIYKADWNKYGKSAGFKRNTYIAEDSDIIIALLLENEHSYGTEDTIEKSKRLGKKIILVPFKKNKTQDFDPLEIKI